MERAVVVVERVESKESYSALFRNKELLNKELDPRFASSAILSLALSVSQKVQGPKAPGQDSEEKCHSVIRD